MNTPECMKTQEIISAASDGEELSAEDVRLAKEHCSECASCTSFVKGLASIRDLSGPQPPEELIATTVAAIREISASASAAKEADAGWAGKMEPILQKKGALAWIGAAASIVVFAAAGTIVGVNYLLEPPTPAAEDAMIRQADMFYDQPVTPQVQPESAATLAGDGRFIVIGGFVYEVTGQRQQPPEGEPAASVVSDLGTGEAVPRDVHISREDSAVAFVVADDMAYEARLVTRTLNRDTYALRSSPIDLFGMWPTLPPEFTVPETPDGSPVFERAERDDRGVRIFVPEGRTPAEGFAIAPNPPAGDPMAGSPNWTWWAPFDLPD